LQPDSSAPSISFLSWYNRMIHSVWQECESLLPCQTDIFLQQTSLLRGCLFCNLLNKPVCFEDVFSATSWTNQFASRMSFLQPLLCLPTKPHAFHYKYCWTTKGRKKKTCIPCNSSIHGVSKI
jgi:hypothetical protein